jgi:hypothetical protein
VCLHVVRIGEGPQVRDHLVLVARRQERREQEDIGHACRERRNGGVARVDNDELSHDPFLDHAREDRCLPLIGLNCQYECHVCLSPLEGQRSRPRAGTGQRRPTS